MYSSDIDDLSTWTPASTAFAIPLRLLIGPDTSEGEESFDLTVCSPEWLADRARREGIVDARHHLVVTSFDWASVSRYLRTRVSACSGATWEEIALQLARFAFWEFEDYRE